MRRRAHPHDVEDVSISPLVAGAYHAAIIRVPCAGMRQAEIVPQLMGAGFEVPLAVVQPRSAPTHKGHTGGPRHVWLAAGDHHLIGIVRVNVTSGHSRRARGIQYTAKFVVITGIVRQPQRRREFGALPLQREGRLLRRHVGIDRIHVGDQSLQS